jgi:hypothetical protein
MKTIDKKFDAVEFMRQQREKLSEKLSNMTTQEIVVYFSTIKVQSEIRPSKKC